MKINIKVDDRLVKKKLDEMQKGLLNPSKPLKDTEKELMEYFGETVFNRGGTPKPWKPLAPSTMRARAKGWGYYKNSSEQRGKILVWTGRLRKSFKSKLSRFKLVISNTAPYFRDHQLGVNKTPKRQILSADEHVVRVAIKNFEKFFNKIIS
jgi:phage gpG-like protein